MAEYAVNQIWVSDSGAQMRIVRIAPAYLLVRSEDGREWEMERDKFAAVYPTQLVHRDGKWQLDKLQPAPFTVGDTVLLRCGGAKMGVTRVDCEVQLVWHDDDGHMQTAVFPLSVAEHLLVKFDGDTDAFVPR